MPGTPRFAAFETVPFGGVIRGQVSGPQTVTVMNTGTGDLTFNATNGFTLGGANAAQFRLTPSAPCANGGILPQGASCTVSVVFAPKLSTALGAKSATLSVRSNATNGTQTVTLTGTAQ
jgi:trimeric autotransporter adhesin